MKQYKNYTCKDHGQQDPMILYKQLDFALVIDLCQCQSGKCKGSKFDDAMIINSSHMDFAGMPTLGKENIQSFPLLSNWKKVTLPANFSSILFHEQNLKHVLLH